MEIEEPFEGNIEYSGDVVIRQATDPYSYVEFTAKDTTLEASVEMVNALRKHFPVAQATTSASISMKEDALFDNCKHENVVDKTSKAGKKYYLCQDCFGMSFDSCATWKSKQEMDMWGAKRNG